MKRDDAAVGNPSMCNTQSTTAFALLNMPVSMIIDQQQLDNNYYQAQLLVNPDQFIGKTDFEKRIAADHALSITQAYQCLKDPLCRAQELLKAKGVPIPGEGGKTVHCPDLLLEIMYIQEELEYCEDNAKHALLLQTVRDDLDQQFQKFEQTVNPEDYLRLLYLTKILQNFQ